jgi:hypothetical protein
MSQPFATTNLWSRGGTTCSSSGESRRRTRPLSNGLPELDVWRAALCFDYSVVTHIEPCNVSLQQRVSRSAGEHLSHCCHRSLHDRLLPSAHQSPLEKRTCRREQYSGQVGVHLVARMTLTPKALLAWLRRHRPQIPSCPWEDSRH